MIYDSTNFGGTKFGLSLVTYSGSGIGTYLVTIPDFRFLFGKWTFFSLSYYYNSSTIGYFPSMLTFQINQTKYPLLTTSIDSFTIDTFTIYSSTYANFVNLKSYKNYILGAYIYETNSAHSPATPPTIKIPPGTTSSNCINTSTDLNTFSSTAKCVLDYFNPLICSTSGNYLTLANTCSGCSIGNTGGGKSNCSTACYFNTLNSNGVLDSCTCEINNSHNSMFLSNSNANLCYLYDYINFAKMNTVTITDVGTASNTKKYTMQFWIFAYNYIGNNFGGITFKWDGHNYIEITYASSTYTYTCYPFYDSTNPSYKASKQHSLTFTINAWNFISCAVDATAIQKYYMNSNTNSFSDSFTDPTSPKMLATSSTLQISDNTSSPEWGVLFYRQIRLWSDCYTSAGFLSRV